MNALTTRTRAALWWLVPLAVLILVIGWESGWGSAIHKRPPPEAPVVPKPVVMTLMPEYAVAGGVAAHTETVARTLFNPTRRQAAIADASKPRMQRGQFALTGTTVVGGKSTAFLREVAGGKARRVQQGETVNGMTVAEVKADRVKLALGDETEELVLRVTTNPRPTVQPAVPAGQPQQARADAASAQPAAVPPAAAPAAATDAAQSLAQRRAAARAAAANAPQPQPGAGVAPPQPAPAPVNPQQPVTGAQSAAGTPPDARWLEIYRRYAQPVAPSTGR